mmetsp:Transcript_38533/g.28385  ORF Transcript_38533/g.28385 Transcript_38533/m.28385 type:complete len:89 (-) Transcript_38533:345-611(-)
MFCSTEQTLYKWNLKTKQLDWKMGHPEANYIYLAMSPDDSIIYSNAYSPFVFGLKVNESEKQEMTKFDIIKDSGWVLFELAFDGYTFI